MDRWAAIVPPPSLPSPALLLPIQPTLPETLSIPAFLWPRHTQEERASHDMLTPLEARRKQFLDKRRRGTSRSVVAGGGRGRSVWVGGWVGEGGGLGGCVTALDGVGGREG